MASWRVGVAHPSPSGGTRIPWSCLTPGSVPVPLAITLLVEPWSGSVPLCAVRALLETPLLVRSARFDTLGMVGAWMGDRLGTPFAVGLTSPCAWLSVPLVAGWALRCVRTWVLVLLLCLDLLLGLPLEAA